MNQKSLEDSLTQPNFDPKAWLRSSVNLKDRDLMELNLTDFSFNLNLLQQTLENQLLSSQQHLEASFTDILKNLPKAKSAYEKLDELI